MSIPFRAILLSFLCFFMSSLVAQEPTPDDGTIVINIVGDGPNAKYIEAGKEEEAPVRVKVGQKVKWVNKSEVQHTATHIAEKNGGTGAFDTSFLEENATKTIAITEEMAAVSVEQTLVYYCRVHPSMESSLIVEGVPDLPPSVEGRRILATMEDSDLKFKPSNVSAVEVGDVFEIVNGEGQHDVEFLDWARVKEHLEILGSEVGFNEETGKSQRTSEPDALLVRFRVLSIPAGRSPINFYCTNHGDAMSGQLSFREEMITSPGGRQATIPEFRTPNGLIATFDAVKVADRSADSYFALAADLNDDGLPDLVTSGLGRPGESEAEVAWFENPTWQKHIIGYFDVPVALAAGDIDEDGLIDLAICFEYGNCIIDCKPENGTVGWLQNPGATATPQDWRLYHIGSHLASHRLGLGYFTQTEDLELVSVPVVGGTHGNIHDPIQVKVFQRPADGLLEAASWKASNVNDLEDNPLRLIHDFEMGKFGTEKDGLLTASEEGVYLYRHIDSEWRPTHIGSGELGQVHRSPEKWKGTGSVAIGSFRSDNFAYAVATEPFHGNIVALYTKDNRNQVDKIRWKRRVLDVLGTPNNRGEGPGHDVVTGDFDGDGNDECLVGLRGPMPYSGVHLYKPVDLEEGHFIRQQVSHISAAIVVTADFDQDGRLDFATIPYRVLTYFEAADVEVMLFLNRTPFAEAP